MSSMNAEIGEAPAAECGGCKDKGSTKCANCPSKGKSETGPAFDERVMKRLAIIKHRIAIVSGKGGVGKSTVTASLALNLSMKGYKVGVLDADVSGPNIPHLLGMEGRKMDITVRGLEPVLSRNGVKVASSELVISKSDTPMLWRGPMRSSLVKQFVTDVAWGELDYLLIDLPPGTGDEPMSVMQMMPLDGVVIVSTSSSLSVLDVSKIINMARELKVPIIGLVENMSFIQCMDCNKKIHLFGESKVEKLAKQYDIPMLGEIPLDPLNSGRDELPADANSLIVSSMKPITERIVSVVKSN